MGILDDVGAGGVVGDIGIEGYGTTLLIILGMILVAVVVGIGIYMYYSKRFKKVAFVNQVPIFLEVAGKIQRIGIDYGKELFIPDTNISLFFLKQRKLYLARPTRSMSKNEFWYKIAENGEWINFDLSSHPDDNTLAIANYDHRDTRYAYVNLKEIIKKNYKDKSTNWWKEYSGVITIIIVAVMFIAMMGFFFWRSGAMLDSMKPIADSMKSAGESIAQATTNLQNVNSGVVPA